MNRGSEWMRWDPHIHAPGTVLNDQFGSGDWDGYLKKIEQSEPRIRAIGVTDYYVTDTYRRVVAEKASGRLPDVDLIFPNIELRLAVAARDGFVNAHLLICPDNADHLEQTDRLLSRLQFEAFGDVFTATKAELIRLGKKANPSLTDDAAALAHAATQFKVNFAQLKEELKKSDWAEENVRVAVAGGTSDGTSGVRQAADKTIREEIERFAHIIFASSSAQRDFWLGRKKLSADEVRARYTCLKPCLHGCDAHKVEDVGVVGERYSWVKGAATFDALRQACIDPGHRAFVGSEPPKLTTPSTVIDQLNVENAPWLRMPQIPLNPGLVAVIGARGSGKTALVDIIAHVCDAIRPHDAENQNRPSASFLDRANALLGTASARIKWASGTETVRPLREHCADESLNYPKARYLSQQFVEELCSSDSMSDGLLQEIERVVFESHPYNEREGMDSFQELLDFRASRHRFSRTREEDAVVQASNQIAVELEKEKLVSVYEAQVAQKTQVIGALEADRAKLVSAGSEALVEWYGKLSKAVETLNSKVRVLNKQRQTFVAMQDEVFDLRRNKAPEMLRHMRGRHSNSGLDDAMWQAFILDYQGDVDAALVGYLAWADEEIKKVVGDPPAEVATGQPYVLQDSSLDGLALGLLEAERQRIEKLMSADVQTQRQYAAVTSKISAECAVLQTSTAKLTDAQGARGRAVELTRSREQAYQRAFDAILAEQAVLEDLYAPLKARLAASSGTLRKLSFIVRRTADVQKWAQEGEELFLDRRKQGPFRGKGRLVEYAEETLGPAWERGTAEEVAAAMNGFREKHQADLLKEAPVPRTEQADYRAWSKKFAQWLFGTQHIRIEYQIEYDGVDIRKLSPGTRGIVLLLLYLALDDADDRPLIIDQPEENLDPKSVYDELVPLFVEAKNRRQVIIVTHNANLVVNTDADQIIVAKVGDHVPGALPPIEYHSGGLDDEKMRQTVCEILEGGERAFRERARRLRVAW